MTINCYIHAYTEEYMQHFKNIYKAKESLEKTFKNSILAYEYNAQKIVEKLNMLHKNAHISSTLEHTLIEYEEEVYEMADLLLSCELNDIHIEFIGDNCIEKAGIAYRIKNKEVVK